MQGGAQGGWHWSGSTSGKVELELLDQLLQH